MADSTVRIGLVLPDVMGTYGDGGNATVLRQRLRLRGIAAEIVEITLADVVPDSLDLYTLGGAEDYAQRLATKHLIQYSGLQRAAARGAPVLAICAAIQVLGHWYETSSGERVDGVGLLDVTTSPQTARTIGEVVSTPLLAGLSQPLTGFENHRGGTVLGEAASPLGAVKKGAGNRAGDGFDGALQGSVVATYMHGPCLARNPELADLLLGKVVGELAPLELPEVDLLRRERLAAVRAARHTEKPTATRRVLFHFESCDTPACRRDVAVSRSDPCTPSGHRAAAGQRTAQGQLVGEFQVAAHRQPGSDSGDGQPGNVAQHPHQVGGGRLALGVGVGGDDHLGDVDAVDLLTDPVQQLADPQLLGTDSGQRIQCPAENVVAAAEFAGALDGLDVLGLLDDAHLRAVPSGVGADAATLVVGDVAAHRAKLHAVADLGQHRGEPVDVRRFDGQQVKGDALRALRPDTRQLAELVDQILDRPFKQV